MLQDINLLETISHATHERIPERVVHAKGTGAHGEFMVTDPNISNHTSAAFLNGMGKKTPLFCRFSTVAGGRGSADTVRDTRGFAFKLYTEEGNLDWLFFSEPVFPIRDGGKFPSFIHCLKGDPKDNLFSSSAFWDFHNHNPEAFHALMMIFTDRGTPQSYQDSKIFSLNTYKFTKPGDDYSYVKIHMRPKHNVKTFNRKKATELAGEDPDWMSRSLRDAIDKKDYPEWTVSAQIIPNDTRLDLLSEGINIFDPTKVIPHSKIPLKEFGKITLTGNPTNFFSEVEGVSFSPTAIVPGWDVSPDPILQTRLFAYGSAARYRLGINFNQSAINKPKYSYNPAKRDGAGNIDNLGSSANYITGVQDPARIESAKQYEQPAQEKWEGKATYVDSNDVQKVSPDKMDYVQPAVFWNTVLKKTGQQNSLVENVAASLSKADSPIRETTYSKSRPPRS